MARQAVALQQIVPGGLLPTLAAIASTEGVSIPNSGNMFFEISNGHTAAINVTVNHGGLADGLTVSGITVSVGAAATKKFGPYTTNFNQPSTNYLTVDVAATTAISIAAYQL